MEGTSVILSQIRKTSTKSNGRFRETYNHSDDLNNGSDSNSHEKGANDHTDGDVIENGQRENSQISDKNSDQDNNNNNNNNNRDIGRTGKGFSSWISSFWVSSSDKIDKEDSEIDQGLVDNYDQELINNKDNNNDNSIWLLGKRYENNEENESFYEVANYYSTPGTFPNLSMQSQTTISLSHCNSEFYKDFTSKIWCTYRHNYPAIKSTNFTHDGGWGCMLRSGQSLLANSLILHFLGREWRKVHKGDETWDKYVEILSWFIDDMSSRCPFSVHRMAIIGCQLGKSIGEWFGPFTASQAIKALVEDFPVAQLSAYITKDGVVYKNDVYKTAKNNKQNKDFQSILILVAIRLGINNLNPVYYDALKAYFRFPQSVGIAGGKPSSSYYFIGTQADGLFYLDPHHSRPAIELKSNDQLTEEELLTYHCDVPRKISISQLDPSMLLGFYCKTKDDFEDFCSRVEKIRQPVFTIAQEAPDYSDDDCGVFSEDDDEFDKRDDKSDDDRSDDDSDADNNFTEQVIELDNVID
ncbi:hypothetical protein Glove_629g19 [Diversispora epigaea]|uniref:Cysteine protease n=1 Tax=Diversispora epigaea TaxID=1348612 RepID=A0A397G5E0_9GLOM|nr:hypothetical protein Glove_629g19 [Diversispora epigaea]